MFCKSFGKVLIQPLKFQINCVILNLNICYQNFHLNKRYKSFYKCNYSDELEAAINKQIASEKQAAEAYLELAIKFLHPSIACIGAGGFFMKMYEEELGHMKQFINYQLTRGGIPFHSCNSNNSEVTILEAFMKSLDMEKNITQQLEKLVCLAESNKDHQCADFVTSKFLGEHMSEIYKLSQYVTNLKRLDSNPHGMYHFDMSLAKLYPYSLK